MKERPLLFSGPMVKAIDGGYKTMTRRIIKPQPIWLERMPKTTFGPGWSWKKGKRNLNAWDSTALPGKLVEFCPHGQAGDRLWVRETYGFCNECGRINYRARQNRNHPRVCEECCAGEIVKWKPSIFMFREDSRILLELTGVKAERLQEISEDDAQREGVIYVPGRAVESFRGLWDRLNAKRGFG